MSSFTVSDDENNSERYEQKPVRGRGGSQGRWRGMGHSRVERASGGASKGKQSADR